MVDLPGKKTRMQAGVSHDCNREKPHNSDLENTGGKYSFEWLLTHCLGFGACWGWVHVAFFSSVLWGSAGEALSLQAWLVNVFANGCAMIALGCLSLKYSPLGKSRVLKAALVVLTVAGTMGLIFGQFAGAGNAFVYAGAVASGIGTAGLLLLWAESYRSIPPLVAKRRTIPGAMAMGVFYYLLICLLPRPAGIAATMLLPLLSVLLMRQDNVRQIEPLKDDCSFAAKPPSRLRGVLPIRFVAFTAVYCLAPGFMRGHTSALPFASTGGVGEAMFAGVAVVMIAVAVASILLFHKPKIDLAYKLVVPLMAAGLLLLPFLAPGQQTVAAVAIMSGYILFEMYVWVSLSDMVSNVSSPAALIFGVGKSGMNIGLLLGSFIGFFFGSNSSMLLVGISVLIVYLFIVMENVATAGIGVALPLSLSGNDEDKPSVKQEKVTLAEAAQLDLSEVFSAILNERCALISSTCGLSARETEVLSLLARGRSLQSIADSLCIAYSTVKTHTDRIYAKTGVHSRQELIALLEAAGE